MSLWSRLANVFRPGEVDRELDEELHFHVEERIRELTAAGMTRTAAAEQAKRRFGSALRLREESRDVKLLPWLDSLVRDVRFAFRMLRKNTAATAVSVVSLALALGACMAAFSLVDALILRPLAVVRADRLVYLTFPTYEPGRPVGDTFNDPLFLRLRDAGRAHVDLFAMSTQVIRPVVFDGGSGDKERLRTQFVSGDAFGMLGVVPAAGRLFVPEDDTRGAEPAAVLSHAFWARRFGSNPSVVGTTFKLGQRPFHIVGVAEPRFGGVEPGRPTDVWMPYSMYVDPRAFGSADYGWFRIIGRLRDDVRSEPAQSVLQATFTNFRREYVEAFRGPLPPNIARFLEAPLILRSAANGPSPLRRQFERPLWILAAIAVLILFIAGSNVANLFLARAAAREHEVSLRLSIGAGRARLIQQVLVESALVAGAACALGLLFARAAAPLVVGMITPPDDPVSLDLGVGWRLVAFAAGLTLAATAVFGLPPALGASSVAPLTALKRGRSRTPVTSAFLVFQVAFSVVVLFVGGLLVLSFARLSRVNPGFAATDVLLLNVELLERMDPARQREAFVAAVDRLRTVPGVRMVSAAEFNLVGRAWTHHVRVPARPEERIEATVAPITDGFFETMGVPVVAGRSFSRADVERRESAATIVNETFARRYFGDTPAVGRSVQARFADSEAGVHDVVGVVADTRYDLREPPAPMIYIPFRTSGTIGVRVAGDPEALEPRLREEVRAANPIFRVSSVRTQSAAIDQTLLRERLLALLAGFFAAVGLVLVGVGLYGVLSYAVVQRTREIGIRAALGARQHRLVRTVIAATGAAIGGGVAVGLAVAFYAARLVDALLFEVTRQDLSSFALPIAALAGTALFAAVIPALRVARIDPVIALRDE